jgi:hypothetical protein
MRIERARNAAAVQERMTPDRPVLKAERARQFMMIKDLLTAAALGTS